MARQTKVEGIVLRRANVGEADKIVTLLTQEGKFAVIAKGIRKPTSRKSGSLEMFSLVELLLSETNGLPIVREAQLKKVFPRLREDLSAASEAFWAGELIDRLVGDDEGGALFDIFVDYLERVDGGSTAGDLRSFEIAVLRELGVKPELHRCVHCSHELRPGKLAWSHSLGGVLDSDCMGTQGFDRIVSIEAVKALRVLGEHGFRVSQRLQIPEPILKEIEEILHHYLEIVAQKKFVTPRLWTKHGDNYAL